MSESDYQNLWTFAISFWDSPAVLLLGLVALGIFIFIVGSLIHFLHGEIQYRKVIKKNKDLNG